MRLVANRKLGSAMMLAVLGLRGVVGIAPQRVVVADAVRVVADVVARRLVAPRLERVASIFTPMRLRRSSRPSSVIFGNLAVLDRHRARFMRLGRGVGFAVAQDLAIDLAGRRLGQLGDECDVPRIFVLAQPLAHEVLDLRGERLVARRGRRRRRPSPPARAAHRARRWRRLRATSGASASRPRSRPRSSSSRRR